MRIRRRPSIWPSSQAANCSCDGCCSLTISSISSWMWVSSFRNSLSAIPRLLVGRMIGAAGGENCKRPRATKKAAAGRFRVVTSRSAVVVFDLGYVGGVMVVRSAVHAARHQVIDDAGDGQHQEQEDQGPANLERPAEEPQDDQDDNRQPDQTRQIVHLLRSLMASPSGYINDIISNGSTMTRNGVRNGARG